MTDATAGKGWPRRQLMARTAATLGALVGLRVPAQARPGVTLPPAVESGGMALAAALARRRSMRQFGPRPLTLAAVAQLLWAAQGITAEGARRSAPSAGARYPLELHLVAARVEGLAAAAYRYLPALHALEYGVADLTLAELQRAALGQAAIGAAAAVIAICAVETRSAGRYGARATRYVAFEAGAAAQNLALQAAALSVGTVVIGAFDDDTITHLLRLPDGERALALLPLGLPN